MCDPSDSEYRSIVLNASPSPEHAEECSRQLADCVAKRRRYFPYERFVIVVSIGATDIFRAIGRFPGAKVTWTRPGTSASILWLAAELRGVALLSLALEKRGVATRALTPQDNGVILTGGDDTHPAIDIDTTLVQRSIAEYFAVVLPGSFGTTRSGAVVSLGNGTSIDIALTLAHQIGAARYELLQHTPNLPECCSAMPSSSVGIGSETCHTEAPPADTAVSARMPVLLRSLHSCQETRWIVSPGETQ